jgi:hypothetical protein
VDSSRVTVGLSGRTLCHGVSELSGSHVKCIPLVNKFSEYKLSLYVLLLTNLLSDIGI